MSLIKGPDFIIAGAARSGTTGLYSVLDQHPDIYMAKPLAPEPKFFSRENLYDKGVKWYLETYFKKRTDELIAGEKSTEYFEADLFPPKVIKHSPDIKIIIILRDPVERMISNYFWSVMNSYEKRPLEEAVKAEINSIKKRGIFNKPRVNDYISRSFYAEKLNNIFSHIPADQVFLINFNEFVNLSYELYNKILKFLSINCRKDYFVIATEIMGKNKNNAQRNCAVTKKVYKQLQNVFIDDILDVNRVYGLKITNGNVNVERK